MKVTVTFNSTPTRNPYEVDNVKHTKETDQALIVTTNDETIFKFPWSAIAWARVDLR